MRTISTLPGPKTPALFNMIEFSLFPRQFALRHAKRFGRVYRMKGAWEEVVFTAEPEHLRRIFAASADTDTYSSVALRWLLGPQSVFTTKGATHQRQRKLLGPPLSGARLRAFGDRMQALAEEHCSALRPGQTFCALELTTAFTLDVIVRTVFGVVGEADAEQARERLRALVEAIAPILFVMPRLQRPWFPPWAKYLSARARFDHWMERQIAARDGARPRSDDVLSLLLDAKYEDGTAMDAREITDQLITLLLAGHETTSVALASILGHVHRHPAVLRDLCAEIDGADLAGSEDVQRLPFLSAVINESLRMDPIVTEVTRIFASPLALDDELTVTPSHLVVVLIEALHHDPAIYPEPSKFRPERFIERTFSPFEFAPFGGGVRRCLGAAFSDYETKIFLATLLRRVSLSLVQHEPEPRRRRNITMGPKHGVPLRVDGLRSAG